MQHRLEILAGREHNLNKKMKHRDIFWTEASNLIQFPTIRETDEFSVNIPLNEIRTLETATEENIRIANKDWDYYKVTAYKPSGATMLFGMFGSIVETASKGHPVNVLLVLNDGMAFVCKMFNDGYQLLKSQHTQANTN